MSKAYLILQNGTVFEGESLGKVGVTIGETVFTTQMTGYLETLTDRSYYGQIITQTFPMIGNYGVIPADLESDRPACRGYIVRQWCQEPSNFRSEGDLDAFLQANNVVGISGIDTRRLTKILRESGVMNGAIAPLPDAVSLEEIAAYEIKDAIQSTSTAEKYIVNSDGRHSVALLDCGIKENIVRELVRRGCRVTVYPHSASAEEILAEKPDGIMLSNGPGDPRAPENAELIANVAKLANSGVPIFGICLGNQMLALASGFEVEKLHYGHRGANQPAKNLLTGRTYITTQNHGYAVKSSSIDPAVATEWFVNVNDGTCEGVRYNNGSVRSVQFHPEAAAGPRDTAFLFDEFIKQFS
ncbi:MAG: carbamoyl phosphate synthase small subunit [Oscillospiraceae bacterium]|jgi:carbamoyl-phosphate synthase small subunit|nr:carbamoyl phosphate synthase small subunit [Oscillospiraceae bacterium]